MSNKFVKFSALILFVLAVLVAFPMISEKMSDGSDKKTVDVSVNMSGFAKENIDKIVIKKGSDERTLNFKVDKWFIGEDEADEDKINQLFKDFADLKVKEMASNNEKNWEKFEVTKDNGFQLTITQDGKDNKFFIGKAGVATSDFYLRRDGIKNVYLVNGNLREKLVWTADKWKRTEDKK